MTVAIECDTKNYLCLKIMDLIIKDEKWVPYELIKRQQEPKYHYVKYCSHPLKGSLLLKTTAKQDRFDPKLESC